MEPVSYLSTIPLLVVYLFCFFSANVSLAINFTQPFYCCNALSSSLSWKRRTLTPTGTAWKSDAWDKDGWEDDGHKQWVFDILINGWVLYICSHLVLFLIFPAFNTSYDNLFSKHRTLEPTESPSWKDDAWKKDGWTDDGHKPSLSPTDSPSWKDDAWTGDWADDGHKPTVSPTGSPTWSPWVICQPFLS